MEELEIVVDHPAGLHLRPAAMFVQTAASFDADIRVRNVTRDTAFKNAKSSLDVMSLQVSEGNTIAITAEGEDAGEAMDALRGLVEGGFTKEE
ncbi:MAG: HPr family phosphocarrier protein [Chloroflexi bacterium]|nr:HPr family phosphocarrier protein [Chloroflexota bacterium]